MARLCCVTQTGVRPRWPDDGPQLYGVIKQRWVPLLSRVQMSSGGAGAHLRGAAALPLCALHTRTAAA